MQTRYLDYFNRHYDFMAYICKPLIKNSPMAYFNYCLKLSSDAIFSLINQAEWAEYYFQAKHAFLLNGTCGIRQWENLMPIAALASANRDFNLHNGFIIENKLGEMTEVIEFATKHPAINALEYYCNHREQIDSFVTSFKASAEPILADSKEQAFILPGKALSSKNHATQRYVSQEKLATLLHKIHLTGQ